MIAFRSFSEHFLRRTPAMLQSVRGVRVGNVEIPDNKQLLYALQYIKGIGPATARQLLSGLQIVNKPTWQLTALELETLRNEVLNYNIGHNLEKENAAAIKRLVDIQCYRGIRHVDGLPCRGQRTSTNARTRKDRGTPNYGRRSPNQ
ncbi:hypothetical protein MLD38_022444 [Melastoma candidum]|uniref:Uncharacterized protein n=1 Tax=Melastoma candidum TaxID=119954 RepID=A0ACB9QIK7_9MYRT|nr:hypothetical protein MLD38_022444 [Melastoma candidum]